MLHLRILLPAELSAAVLALLGGYAGVGSVSIVRGAGVDPTGDLIDCEVVREAVDELISELGELGLDPAGAISVSQVTLSLSAATDRALREAPGNSPDSVIWQQVEAHTAEDAAFSGTFLAFLTIATLLAGIGVIENSPITVVGAMVVGPEFGPLAAISVGWVRRRRDLLRKGTVALTVGFPAAILLATGAAFLALRAGLFDAGTMSDNSQVEFIYEPGAFSLIVALLAGAAGMLSTTSQKSAALVGVFISVTTVPAAGFIAVGVVLGNWSQVGGSALQLVINLVGIVLAAVVTLLIVRQFDRYRAHRRSGTARSTTETPRP